MIVIHHDRGMAYGRRAYYTRVDVRNRLSIRDERYALGYEPPHYPVPALQTDTLYWRLPKLGQNWNGSPLTVMQLIAAWQLWRK